MTVGPVVIVGASHAGFQLAASLRQAGFERTGVFGGYRLWTRALLRAEAAAQERGAP